mgnify:FL=1
MRALLLLACANAQVHFTCDVAKEVAKYRNLQNLKLLFDGRRVGNATLGPLMRKTGSTTMQRFAGSNAKRVRRAADYLGSNIVASVRDPIERFASGYRQVETFYELGWVPKHFFKGQCVLKWTRDDCAGNPQMKSGYVLAKRKVPAAAAARRRTRQIRRLLRFISDVERCGFFDDHLYPMAPYFAALARAGVSMDSVSLVKTDELDAKLPSILGKPMRVGTAMATAGRGWARTLVQAATDSADPDWALARAAVRRICRLVAVDYACFSFEPPDLCRVALRGAVVPEPYPPPISTTRPALAVAAPRIQTCVAGVEDPVARLLRNHQTYDAQYLLGWRDADVDTLDLRFPERHCFVWHQIDDHARHEATDLHDFGLEHKLARLAAFVDDIAARGFFDESLRPQAEKNSEEASPAACFDKVRAFCKQRRVPVDGGRKNLPETGGVQCAREYVRFNRALGPCSLHLLHDFIYAHGQRSRAEPWAVARAELVGAAARLPVARRILATACALYEADFACYYGTRGSCAALVRRAISSG